MNKEIVSFNTGEMTPETDALSNIEKYASGCRHLENFLPRIYGSAERRPGTRFVNRGYTIIYDALLVYPTLHELTRELPSIVSYENDNLSYENQTIESDLEEENRIYYEGKLVFYEGKQVHYFGVGSTGRESSGLPIPVFTHYENDEICWENETIITSGEIIYSRNVTCYENETVFWEDDTVVASVEIPTKPVEPYVWDINEVFYDNSTPNLANREVVTYEDDPVFYYETWLPVITAADLQAMEKNRRYILNNDIDLDGETWTPIANFSGVIEGSNYTISNLTVTGSKDAGMFDNLNTGANIRNLILDSATISTTATASSNYKSAVLAGHITSQSNIIIKNVHIINSSVTGRIYIGGLIGYILSTNNIQIFDCEITDCTITGDVYVGSLIGYLTTNATSSAATNIVRCNATGGTVVGTRHALYQTYPNDIGGLFGWITGGGNYFLIVHSCYATVNVITTGAHGVGGFIGYTNYLEEFINCYATGNITVSKNTLSVFHNAIGGFTGNESTYATYINCYATSNVTVDGSTATGRTGDIGGFIGWCDWTSSSYILRCYSTGDVDVMPSTGGSWSSIGGFIGTLNPADDTGLSLIERCWSEGDIAISNEIGFDVDIKGGIGGFIGHIDTDEELEGITIKNCYSWGQIISENPQNNVIRGGFIGTINAVSSGEEWVIATEEKYTGTYSAKAGTIIDEQTSVLSITQTCISGNVTFYYKVSSEENYDFLTFYDNDTEIESWSGEVDWTQYTYAVTAGVHTFKWVYSKDGSVAEGDDTAWIDDIVFSVAGGSTDDFETGDFIHLDWITDQVQLVNISNCYDAQTDTRYGSGFTNGIPAGTYAGGFIAYDFTEDSSTVNNSFWDVTTSSIATSLYGTGYKTLQMQTKSNYEDADWDFYAIWEMVEL